MEQIVKIALNCSRQLEKALRSTSRITQNATRPLLRTAHQKILSIKLGKSAPKELELREIDAALNLVHDTVCEECGGESPTPELTQLGSLITAAFPPLSIPREKAKPTIRLASRQ